MKYEVMTYTCSRCDYYVVYVLPNIRRVAVYMSLDMEEVRDFLYHQKNCEDVFFTVYNNEGLIIGPSICKECD